MIVKGWFVVLLLLVLFCVVSFSVQAQTPVVRQNSIRVENGAILSRHSVKTLNSTPQLL
jgi:hypothetical protein